MHSERSVVEAVNERNSKGKAKKKQKHRAGSARRIVQIEANKDALLPVTHHRLLMQLFDLFSDVA